MAAIVQLDGHRMLTAALSYARLGWHVLPLWPGTKQPCGRLVPQGLHNATTDEATIRRWWQEEPQAGIGISLLASNLVAIDIDPRNGGLATIEGIEQVHGPLASDVLAYTGGGGEHRVFSCHASLAAGLPGTLGPGVDVKANGYIAVEPSTHPNGRQYVWEASSSPLEGVVPSPLPDWLRSTHRPAATTATGRTVHVTDEQWREIQSAIAVIPADTRDTWLSVGMALHATGRADAFATWDRWSQSSPAKYDPIDQTRVWNSFKARGLDGVTHKTLFKLAQDEGWRAPTTKPAKLPDESIILDWQAMLAQAAASDWIIKRVFPASSVGVIFGASGTFKSFIALDAAMHVAHAQPWLGHKTKGCEVLYLAAEGGTGSVHRVKAWHQFRRLDPQQARFRFVLRPLELLTQAALLRAEIERLGLRPQLIVIDTFSQTFSGEENSANEVAEYLRALRSELAIPFGACVVVIHHSGHSATERPRGSSAIRANTDFLYAVFRDEKDMLATLENTHQKDGELHPAVEFVVSSESLGKDADGDPITSLVAHQAGSPDELIRAIKATPLGQGYQTSNRRKFLEICQHGVALEDAKAEFFAFLGDDKPANTRRVTFNRQLEWAAQNGVLVVENGVIVRLARGDEPGKE